MSSKKAVAELASAIGAESGMEVEVSEAMARLIVSGAMRHQALCAKMLSGESLGLGEGHDAIFGRQVRNAEAEIRVLVAHAGEPFGIKGVEFNDDARGATVRLRFASGASNSLTGLWAVLC